MCSPQTPGVSSRSHAANPTRRSAATVSSFNVHATEGRDPPRNHPVTPTTPTEAHA